MWKPVAKLVHLLRGDIASPLVTPKYRFIDVATDQLSIVEITNGLYGGTQLRYGEVGFIPEGDSFKLRFKTEIITHPWWGKIKDSDDDFTVISGNILREMIMLGADEPGKFLVM